ncbi:MAG: hypothetical protein ABIG43_01585 [Chloroflexota bacterium]
MSFDSLDLEALAIAISTGDIGSIDNYDFGYSQSWQEEAAILQNMGLYKRVARELDLKSGDVHVDLGVGGGHLLEAILSKTRKAVLLGVDRSPNMLSITENKLARKVQRRKIKRVGSHNRYFHPSKGVLERVYYNDESKLPENCSSRVFLIDDDIRELQVTRTFLGSGLVDSGSFCFPGGSENSLSEAPFPLGPVSISQMRERWRGFRMNVRRSAVSFLSEKIKPGGTMILVDRYGLTEEPQKDEICPVIRDTQFGDFEQYWDSGRHNYSELAVIPHESIAYGATAAYLNVGGESIEVPTSVGELVSYKVYLAVHKFTRNGEPYQVG